MTQSHAKTQMDTDDFIVLENNEPPRALIGMRGHYRVEGWQDPEGQVRQFECEILKISPHMITLAGPVTGAVGNWVVAQFEYLGKFEGPIVQNQKRTLVMKIVGTNEERAKLAAKLAWVTDAEKSEGRRYPRLVPDNPDSTISLPGQLTVPCEVIDYSVGGVAVYAEVSLENGALLKVGSVLGRVVRQFPGGFGVSFLTLQNPDLVEASVCRPRRDDLRAVDESNS